jgi:hypothetical protein
MNHDHNIEYIIELMIEAGFTITEIEKQLGVTIQGRVHTIEWVSQVIQTQMCGEIEVNVN